MAIESASISRTLHEKYRYSEFSGLHFPVLGLNMKIYSVNLRIQSEYGKVRTRITPKQDTFYAVGYKAMVTDKNMRF